jgi:formamidopyrimidine-DNA glycosylase
LKWRCPIPELPEVEAMAVYLDNRVSGMRISNVQVYRGRYLPEEQANDLEDRLIERVCRRGKYLIFKLDIGMLVCHNAMSGYWDLENDPWTFDYVEGKRTATEKDVRVDIRVYNDGPEFMRTLRRIRFHDSRLFGSLQYWPKAKEVSDVPAMKKLGPEAIATMMDTRGRELLTSDHLVVNCSKSKTTIKDVLIDQRIVSGIGNIYATEALWRAHMNPWMDAKDASEQQIGHLFTCIQNVLKRSIDTGINYKEFLKIYRKKLCERCSSKVEKANLSGRSTYFCRSCQSVS